MVVFSLFLGPRSDTVGRKMLLMVSLLGSVFLCVCYIVNVYFFDELVEFLWIESLSYCFVVTQCFSLEHTAISLTQPRLNPELYALQ